MPLTSNALCQTNVTTSQNGGYDDNVFRVLQDASEPIRLEFTADWNNAHSLVYVFFLQLSGQQNIM